MTVSVLEENVSATIPGPTFYCFLEALKTRNVVTQNLWFIEL